MTILMAILLSQMTEVPVCFLAEEKISMYSTAYALTDGYNGRVLCGKKETEAMANASTTKILTCILALEGTTDLKEEVVISKNAASAPRVHLGVSEGETYSLELLLHGLMLESYNDCAVAIAEHVSGSVEEFVCLMNQKAEEIGCRDTHFVTPNGLDGEDEEGSHHTTAADLCRIMEYCCWESPQRDKFLAITQKRSYEGFTNRNLFLDRMEGVVSGKTGYTSKAGYCYVAAYEKDGKRFCIALLGCGWPNHKNYKWADAKTLLQYAVEEYEAVKKEVEIIASEVPVDGIVGKPWETDLKQLSGKNLLRLEGRGGGYTYMLGQKEMVKDEEIYFNLTKLPIEKEEPLGKRIYRIGTVVLDVVSLRATEEVRPKNFASIFSAIAREFLIFSSQTACE